MSRETERVLISSHFQSAWDLLADGPIAWPNKPFSTPDNAPFCVFNIVERGSYRASLGGVYLKKYPSTMQIDIFTPTTLGTKRSRLLADRLEDVYDSLTLVTSDGESVNFYSVITRGLAANEQRASNLDDNWDRYIVEAPYVREKIIAK